MALEPGTQVGRYRVARLIAQGGMAEVYRADQELTGGILRPVALKVIRPEYAESEDFREMFLDEARTACTLSHPNIVHIYEVGDEDGVLFMAMELVPGESLATVGRTLRERGQRFSDEALLAIGAHTCSALEGVHALKLPGTGHLNLVHRDVSPHNLLLSASGNLKLIDFGIAKALSNQNITSAGITKGKAGYFSPEQAMGLRLDGRSDLFSLGVTLYKLASGGTPFDAYSSTRERHEALVAGKWEDLEEAAPGLMPAFYEIVRRALRLKPEERFESAAEMREAIEGLAFDAGLPIGSSSLQGYVEDNDGEISVPSMKVRQTTQSGRHPRPRSREGMSALTPAPVAPSGPSGRAIKIALAAATAVAVMTIGGTLVLMTRAEPAPVVAAAPLVAPPAPAPVAPVVQHKPVPIEELAPLIDSTRPVAPTKPKREGKPKVVTAKAVAPDEPAPVKRIEAEAIPDGEGQLRIGASPDGLVTIAGKKRGDTPLNLKLHSGAYTVEIVSQENQKRGACTVKVFPDKTTRLRYDFSAEKCVLDYL